MSLKPLCRLEEIPDGTARGFGPVFAVPSTCPSSSATTVTPGGDSTQRSRARSEVSPRG